MFPQCDEAIDRTMVWFHQVIVEGRQVRRRLQRHILAAIWQVLLEERYPVPNRCVPITTDNYRLHGRILHPELCPNLLDYFQGIAAEGHAEVLHFLDGREQREVTRDDPTRTEARSSEVPSLVVSLDLDLTNFVERLFADDCSHGIALTLVLYRRRKMSVPSFFRAKVQDSFLLVQVNLLQQHHLACTAAQGGLDVVQDHIRMVLADLLGAN
mmetsp:Transcript_5065/g.7170  ORF Transcript_5065/g.7170 Transcript_5065/m.7170 type:complete len:212 (+) Transcript_5065:91-726(+)